MGVDIRGVFQKKVGATWQDVSSDYNEDRDYYLHSWLAPGRVAIHPISDRRGLPADFPVDESGRHPISSVEVLPPSVRQGVQAKPGADPSGMYRPMGEWGFSWLFAREILGAPVPQAMLSFAIPIEEFRRWDGTSIPEDWIGRLDSWEPAVNHRDISTAESVTEDTQYIVAKLNYDFTDHFRYFLDEVRRLQETHGEVRFVFGFA